MKRIAINGAGVYWSHGFDAICGITFGGPIELVGPTIFSNLPNKHSVNWNMF